MKLKNHIVYPFLTDVATQRRCMNNISPGSWELAQTMFNNMDKYQNPTKEQKRAITLYAAVTPNDGKVFYVTETVIDKLELLKVTPKNGQYDWSVFGDFPNQKYTFIFPQKDGFLRMCTKGKHAFFIHITPKGNGVSYSLHDGEFIFPHDDKDLKVASFIYRLLCFIFLSENEEEILKPGEKRGTKKNGKVINELPFPLTIINSKWSITSIRTEGFGVSGHLALRWTGEDRKVSRMVFIEPYEKKGYKRTAKNQSVL